MWAEPKVFKQIQARAGLNIFTEADHNRLASLIGEVVLQDNDDPYMAMTNLARENNLINQWVRISQILQDNKLLNQIEMQTYIRRVIFQRLELKWQQLFTQVKRLEDQGDFDSLLRFVLRINTFINDVQEGGTL